MGIMNKGVLYALWDYEPQNGDELPMREGDCMTVIRREDEEETEWWWARLHDKEGYVPRNLLGVSYPHRGRFCASPGCAGPHCVRGSVQPTWPPFVCATWTFGVRTVLDLHVGEVPTSMSASPPRSGVLLLTRQEEGTWGMFSTNAPSAHARICGAGRQSLLSCWVLRSLKARKTA